MILKSKTNLIKRTLCAIWWVLLILLALILVRIIGAKLTGEVPSVCGYSVMNIVSGSMEDEIPKGSYILIKKAEPEEIKRGDIICFYSTDPKIYGMPNTHRVADEPIITDDGIEFVTKGDANPVKDSETAKGERLIGVYVKRLDGITSFSNALKGNVLIIVILCLQLCLVIMAVYTVLAIKGNKKTADKNGDSEENKEQSQE